MNSDPIAVVVASQPDHTDVLSALPLDCFSADSSAESARFNLPQAPKVSQVTPVIQWCQQRQATRLIVIGPDSLLACVLTAVMRAKDVTITLGFVPSDPHSVAAENYGLSTVVTTAWQQAMRAEATALPLMRDDTGTAIVGSITYTGSEGALVGEAYADDQLVFSGTCGQLTLRPTATMPGVIAATDTTHGLFRSTRWLAARAVQLGTTAAVITRDGVTKPRPAKRSTVYRELQSWQLAAAHNRLPVGIRARHVHCDEQAAS